MPDTGYTIENLQSMARMSDSDLQLYLQELEKAGIVSVFGGTGPKRYYRLVTPQTEKAILTEIWKELRRMRLGSERDCAG